MGRALEPDAHTIGQWAKAFAEGGPKGLVFEQAGGSPTLDVEQRAELKAAVQELPSQSGIGASNWKAVCQFVPDRFGLALSRSSCLNYPVSSTGQALHRLGFVLKRRRKDCSRRIRRVRKPLWRSTPSWQRRPDELEPGYSLCAKDRAASSPIWPTVGKKSSDDVAPSFRLAPQN